MHGQALRRACTKEGEPEEEQEGPAEAATKGRVPRNEMRTAAAKS